MSHSSRRMGLSTQNKKCVCVCLLDLVFRTRPFEQTAHYLRRITDSYQMVQRGQTVWTNEEMSECVCVFTLQCDTGWCVRLRRTVESCGLCVPTCGYAGWFMVYVGEFSLVLHPNLFLGVVCVLLLNFLSLSFVFALGVWQPYWRYWSVQIKTWP